MKAQRALGALDDVGIFLLTWACVIFSAYLPAMRETNPIVVHLSLWGAVLALIPATAVTAVTELKGIITLPWQDAKTDDQKAAARAGRQRNLWTRILLAIVLGLAWPKLLDMLLRILGIS